jgi:hypothetical protein
VGTKSALNVVQTNSPTMTARERRDDSYSLSTGQISMRLSYANSNHSMNSGQVPFRVS